MARKRRRKKKRPGKGKEALRVHSFRRALERYPELDFTKASREIVRKIKSGDSTPVERQSLRVVVHDVTLDSGEEVRVAYDKKRGAILTFLYKDPEDYLSPEARAWLTSGPSA